MIELTSLVRVCLIHVDRVRAIVYQFGLDIITLYSSANNSKLDVEQRRAKLDLGREYGQLQLEAHRQKTLEGGKQR
jgi:hypothetical protein